MVSSMILSMLKEQTRPLHDQIEHTMDLPSRLRSPDTYKALLGRFYGFYAPLEVLLGSVEGAAAEYARIGFDFAKRCKTEILKADLRALGMSEADISELPQCTRDQLPAIHGMPEAIGCWYVLEGSTLGGQIIRREVASQLGIFPGNGCSFFSSYGDQLGPMWKAFGVAAEQFVASAADPAECAERVVRAANETFVRLDAWVAKTMAC